MTGMNRTTELQMPDGFQAYLYTRGLRAVEDLEDEDPFSNPDDDSFEEDNIFDDDDLGAPLTGADDVARIDDGFDAIDSFPID